MASKAERLRNKRAVRGRPAIASCKAEIQIQQYPNPLYMPSHSGEKWNPDTIPVAVNIRESAIGTMAAKGLLSAHQIQAAVKFRRLWELLGGAGAGSLDYSREPVDGGGVREALTEAQFDAGKQINSIRMNVLTIPRMFDVVCKVAGEGRSVASIGASHRERTTLADYLKDGLECLAEYWGYTVATNQS